MAEPAAVLYDAHNDSSVNATLWDTNTAANGSVSEDTAFIRMQAPGTGAGDADRAGITQKVITAHGCSIAWKYTRGVGQFVLGALGISDADGYPDASAGWNGNQIRITIGSYGNPSNNEIVLSASGYTITQNNGPISVVAGTTYTLKIYENGDGTIVVYHNTTLLGVLTGNILANSRIRGTARAAAAADRNFNLYFDTDSDYAANPLATASTDHGYAFLMSLAGLMAIGAGILRSASGLIVPKHAVA